MAGHSMKNSPRQQLKHLWPNFLERETREKKRENCSPANPIPIQPRYAHALRIVADTNQPLTRAPTRTPCGEAGSEDSWLRVAHGIQQKRANRFSYFFIDVSINWLIKLFDLVADF